jgi:hypothetical protein
MAFGEDEVRRVGLTVCRIDSLSSLKGRDRSSRRCAGCARFSGVPGRVGACVTRSRCPGAAPGAQRGRTAWTSARMAAMLTAAGKQRASGYAVVGFGLQVCRRSAGQGRGFGCRSSLRRAGGGMKRCAAWAGRGQSSGRPRRRSGVMTSNDRPPSPGPNLLTRPLRRARGSRRRAGSSRPG